MTTTDIDGVPVIELDGPPVRRRFATPLLILLCTVLLLAISGGLYAWLHRPAPEASVPVTAQAAGIQRALHSAGTALAAPKALTAPKSVKAVVASSMVYTPLAGALHTRAKEVTQTRAVLQPPKFVRGLSLPPADSRISQMRKTFEQNGWSLYWLDDKNEVTAWKSEGKTGYEIRLIPGARHATVLKTGGRNIILKRWTVNLASAPEMRGYHVYTTANTLLRSALTHN